MYDATQPPGNSTALAHTRRLPRLATRSSRPHSVHRREIRAVLCYDTGTQRHRPILSRCAYGRDLMLAMLLTDLNKLCDDMPFHSGWYLKNLRTGETAHRNGHVVVPSASTRKIAIMMAALKAVHEGRLALDQRLTIEAKYQDNDSGCFQHLQPGLTFQLRDALVMMIIVSDNTCTGTGGDLVGLEAINALSQAVGMRGTTHRYGIPPAGMAGYRRLPRPTPPPRRTWGCCWSAFYRARTTLQWPRSSAVRQHCASWRWTFCAGSACGIASQRACRLAPRWRIRRERRRVITMMPGLFTRRTSRCLF